MRVDGIRQAYRQPTAVKCYTLRVSTLRATVHNGRLILDAPTDLPEGAEVMLVIDDGDDAWRRLIASAPPDDTPLTDEEREAIEKYRRGECKLIPHEEVRRKLAARSAK